MNEIEEILDDLELKLKRLKIEYDQYFVGALKREPMVTKGEVQRIIQRFLSTPPPNARYKFRFNSLVARYQSYRQLWGRTLREIEAGTYQPLRFRAKMQELEGNEEESTPARAKRAGGQESSVDVQKLYDALVEARRKTGEGMGSMTRERLEKMVSQQMSELQRKHPSAKVRFQVVREGDRTRLKARVIKP